MVQFLSPLTNISSLLFDTPLFTPLSPLSSPPLSPLSPPLFHLSTRFSPLVSPLFSALCTPLSPLLYTGEGPHRRVPSVHSPSQSVGKGTPAFIILMVYYEGGVWFIVTTLRRNVDTLLFSILQTYFESNYFESTYFESTYFVG